MDRQLRIIGVSLTFGVFLAVVTTVDSEALSAEVTIFPSIDGSAKDEDRDGVWEAATLQTSDTTLLAYNGGPTRYNWHCIIEFPLDAIPPWAVIQDATFHVRYALSNATDTETVKFNGYAGDGAFAMDDFAVDNQLGPMYNARGPNDGTKWYKVPVTALIQSLVDAGGTHAGLMIENVSWNQTGLNSSEAATDYWPRLEVTYIPEPATLALLGLFGPALLRRRRACGA